MMVGSIEPDIDWRDLDLDGRCVAILAGTPDEIRAAGALLYQDVTVAAATVATSEDPKR